MRILSIGIKPVRYNISRSRLGSSRITSKRFQSSGNIPKPGGKQKGLKALMKEYGFSALGVYLGLSAIDLPLCYLLVHSMGQEEIEKYENSIKQYFGYGMTPEELGRKHAIQEIERQQGQESENNVHRVSSWTSIFSGFSWTEFAIAYGIHKSLIFIRLPITAAITPAIVKSLRSWGFKLGTGSIASNANVMKDAVKDITAANSSFGTRATKKKRWFSWFF